MDKTLQDALAVAGHYGLTDRDLAAVVEAATVAKRAEIDAPELMPMTHPSQPGLTLGVDPDAVPVYEQSGWDVAVDTSAVAAAESEPDTKTAPVVDEAPTEPATAKAAAKKEN